MSLNEKAIDIKGKKYVLVSDRVLFFNENFTKGSIVTSIEDLKENSVVFKATVDTGDGRTFTGYAQEVNDGFNNINKTSMIENAETSAVGRALGFMGIGIIDSIASVDEIKKATSSKFNKRITGDYFCAKCGCANKGVEIKRGNYGPYFKCSHCNEFSNTKKMLLDGEDLSKRDF